MTFEITSIIKEKINEKKVFHTDRAIGYYCTTELFFKNKKIHILTPGRVHFTLSHLHSISVQVD